MCSQIHSFASNMGYCPQKRHMTVEKGVKRQSPSSCGEHLHFRGVTDSTSTVHHWV